jgi:pyruvate formate lyase activating enzyme
MIHLYKQNSDKLECLLCPHYCKIATGKAGICGVRRNNGEKIELITHGILSGYALDPVEKKPLYHFFPGQNILSLGSYGCNMRCDFCQNYQISQKIPDGFMPGISSAQIIKDALSSVKNIGLAFTYNEPVVWFEYMRDLAMAAKAEGLFTVMVSNGYVNSEPLEEITGFIDAFNIDLKAFNNDFYKKLAGAELAPVKSSLKQIAASGKHLEITTLVIPGQNDDEREMSMETEWIAGELGKDTPLHLSGYYPTYKRDNPRTTEESLKKLYDIAIANLDYVYIGNSYTDTGQNTSCPVCGTIVTVRSGYKIRMLNLNEKGACSNCGTPVYKHFTFS